MFVGQSGNAQPFAFRSSLGGNGFPRYVEAADKEILKALAAADTSNTVLHQAVATGRCFWKSLRTQALRKGPARSAPFAWHSLPNGDQELRCETGPSVEVMLDADSALYIDSASAELGALQSIHPLSLVRHYWGRAPIAPEEVATTNEQIAKEMHFPRLLEHAVQKHALSTLTAQLTLTAGPEATLRFVYNDLPVDSNRLQDEHATVRQLMAGVLYEIPRDLTRELEWRTRLTQLLPPASGVREAWLAFMLESVPALRSEGWSVVIAEEFPYQLAKADDWYGDLEPIAARVGSICAWASWSTGSTSIYCRRWCAICRPLLPEVTRLPCKPRRPPCPRPPKATPAAESASNGWCCWMTAAICPSPLNGYSASPTRWWSSTAMP